MLAANQIQNSSSGRPWRSASGLGLIPLVSMLQARSAPDPPSRPTVPVSIRPHTST